MSNNDIGHQIDLVCPVTGHRVFNIRPVYPDISSHLVFTSTAIRIKATAGYLSRKSGNPENIVIRDSTQIQMPFRIPVFYLTINGHKSDQTMVC